MNAPKKKGTAWESDIVRFLKENGVPYAERRALGGTEDRGDIAGIPGIVIEAKSGALHLAAWVAEAEAERVNDGADFGIVWAKRPGKASPADGYAIMTGATLIGLLRAAGYIAQQPTLVETALTQLGPDSRDALLTDLRELLTRFEAMTQHAATGRPGGRAQDAPAPVPRPVDIHWGCR
jgi:hypothetical protein